MQKHGNNAVEVQYPTPPKNSRPLVSEVPFGTIGKIYALLNSCSSYEGVVVIKLYSGNMARLDNGSTWGLEASKNYTIEVLPVGTKITLEVQAPSTQSEF